MLQSSSPQGTQAAMTKQVAMLHCLAWAAVSMNHTTPHSNGMALGVHMPQGKETFEAFYPVSCILTMTQTSATSPPLSTAFHGDAGTHLPNFANCLIGSGRGPVMDSAMPHSKTSSWQRKADWTQLSSAVAL